MVRLIVCLSCLSRLVMVETLFLMYSTQSTEWRFQRNLGVILPNHLVIFGVEIAKLVHFRCLSCSARRLSTVSNVTQRHCCPS